MRSRMYEMSSSLKITKTALLPENVYERLRGRGRDDHR